MEKVKSTYNHTSVLPAEVLSALNLAVGYTVVDCTTGGAGHSREIAEKIGRTGHLICMDKDAAALEEAKRVLAGSPCKITFVHDDFSNIQTVLKDLKIDKVNAILADIGVSSHQIDEPERGFSYTKPAPMDMRMNRDQTKTAADVINHYSPAELERIIHFYGEERFSKRIAAGIIENRPIETTGQLAELVKTLVPASYGMKLGHPAKRTFQAVRIEVNNELGALEKLVKDAPRLLETGGRIAVISFHSLEDRIVKNQFRLAASACLCPPRTPICICGHKPTLKVITKNPITASEEEIAKNPRSQSAKLRVAERITDK